MMGNVSPKVTGGVYGVGVAGATTILLTYLVSVIWKVEVPSEVAQAITVVIAGLGSFIGGYVRPHPVG